MKEQQYQAQGVGRGLGKQNTVGENENSVGAERKGEGAHNRCPGHCHQREE